MFLVLRLWVKLWLGLNFMRKPPVWGTNNRRLKKKSIHSRRKITSCCVESKQRSQWHSTGRVKQSNITILQWTKDNKIKEKLLLLWSSNVDKGAKGEGWVLLREGRIGNFGCRCGVEACLDSIPQATHRECQTTFRRGRFLKGRLTVFEGRSEMHLWCVWFSP